MHLFRFIGILVSIVAWAGVCFKFWESRSFDLEEAIFSTIFSSLAFGALLFFCYAIWCVTK